MRVVDDQRHIRIELGGFRLARRVEPDIDLVSRHVGEALGAAGVDDRRHVPGLQGMSDETVAEKPRTSENGNLHQKISADSVALAYASSITFRPGNAAEGETSWLSSGMTYLR